LQDVDLEENEKKERGACAASNTTQAEKLTCEGGRMSPGERSKRK